MKELFDQVDNKKVSSFSPLAFRMLPDSLDSFVGQEHLLNPGNQLRRMIDSGKLFSVIFYGTPGCGKSALANIIASSMEARVEKINAVSSNIREIREIIEKSKYFLKKNKKTLLIIDEFHHFNKTRQEALLPDVEEGTFVLVGITTENPFYFVSGPLLSRTRVFKFKPLEPKEIKWILMHATRDKEKGLGDRNVAITDGAVNLIIEKSEGDARYSLNILEIAASTTEPVEGKIVLSEDIIRTCIGEKKFLYDRTGDQHYDTISAFIKSMRGSDPDAAVYYLAKMILSGEDPRFIARRIVICASEDVGNADPQALTLSNSALRAVEYVGMPEARIILAQAAIYVACAPKSNASYLAINRALKYVEENEVHEVPEHLTKAGSNRYKYPHDYSYGFVKQKYVMVNKKFYEPVGRGHEKYINKYLNFIEKLKSEERGEG